MMGLSPTDAVAAVVPLGIAAVGTNCGRSLADADVVVERDPRCRRRRARLGEAERGRAEDRRRRSRLRGRPGDAGRARRRLRRAGRAGRRWVLRVDARARRRDRAGTRAASYVVSARGRSSGVLLHVTSLPSGRLDEEAYRFVDWLVEAGQSWWQLLPLHIPDELGSPYSSRSAFAGYEGLLSPPGSKHYDDGEGDEGAPQGDWLEEWVASPASPSAGPDAFPARVAGAEGVRQRARRPADRRHPALRRRRLVRRADPSASSSTARSSRARRRR